ncbi:MAG: RluA family pseudouridine synthase [Actinobacteria bacterium]|nr:RluA family pseudouridine synthase [Actinomycetota bacterium]
MHVTIPEALAGERVDRAVALLTGLTRADVAAMVEEGRVCIDGRPVRARSRRVATGESLEVDVPVHTRALPVPDSAVPFAIVHADDDVVVVDKPAGVVVHPGAGVHASTLVHGLLAQFPDLGEHEWPDTDRPGIVHRLDKDTSGLLLVARKPSSYAMLRAQLDARTIGRVYLALAVGQFEHDAGTIDAPVGRSTRGRTRMAVAAGGREARTHYSVVERFAGATLVECTLETGRTHQIRVHLAAIGHPVAGDARYRGPKLAGLRRPFLHAHKLAFDHPAGGDRRHFTSLLPDDLVAATTAVRAEH